MLWKCLVWMEVFCWICRVWCSKEGACCSGDIIVYLSNRPDNHFTMVFAKSLVKLTCNSLTIYMDRY